MPDLSQFISEASTMASRVDLLFFFLLVSTSAIVVVIAGLIIYFCIKYRRRSDNLLADQTEGSTRLEVIWTVVPLVLALGVFGWSARLYYELEAPPADALDVYVVGKQWMWEFQHVEGMREIGTLHVPAGQTVRLTMTSQDVIHSFFVPAFRTKQDAVPGRYTVEWFQATTPGSYQVFCAEYCGTLHSGMLAQVIVLSPQDYQAWLGQGSGQAPSAAGAQLFVKFGCSNCHQTDNQGQGPSLAGVFGRSVQLTNGQIVTADENYIRESILNPPAKIVAGYQPIMPSFQGQLNEDQLIQLLAYIKSLGNGAPSAPAPNGSPTP